MNGKSTIAAAGTFIAAWILIILSLSVLANTTWGKSLVAYVLWLMIFLVVVTHWPAITDLLSSQATGLPEPLIQTTPYGPSAQPSVGVGVAPY